ncbi:relaxin receptor 2-like isoform X2 [Scylla paramamosain]|uniref:relaxin receptor 2-like isoform X2 n=1 Tax=Scylla paramamosain TaxID=85552 RepID=UPI0030826DF5
MVADRVGRRRQAGPLPSPLLLHLHLLVHVLFHFCFSSAARLESVNPDGSCSTGWFLCTSTGDVCLEQRFLCDQKEDCPDGEDEIDNCVPYEADSNLTVKILEKEILAPDNITRCDLTRVPPECYCRLGTHLVCRNAHLTSIPQDLDPNVTSLLLGNNSIVLSPDDLQPYPRLNQIFLDHNQITALPAGVFSGLPLVKVFLSHNLLRDDLKSLQGLSSLSRPSYLHLCHNLISNIDLVLDLVPGLLSLWINYSPVTMTNRTVSRNAQSLTELWMEGNRVQLTPGAFRGFTNLESLYLRYNGITDVGSRAFEDLRSLKDLELNYNLIRHLRSDSFLGLETLVSLNLDHNPLLTIHANAFKPLGNLASLWMGNVELSMELLMNISTHPRDETHLANLTHLIFKRFRYCGYFPHVPDCYPKADGVSSFQHLLVRLELRVGVWIVSLLTLIGNLMVLGGRVFSRDDNKILSLFIRNLAVADLLTGLYLLVIAVKDIEFRARYSDHAYYWMTSWQCTITGVLAMTSSEVSVLILSFMSVERWLCITWPLAAPKLSLGGAKMALTFIWFTGISLALAPVLYYRGQQQRFYGTNGLCFPLHLDDPWVPGWLYSGLLFVGLNQLGVILILVSYTGMFYSIRRTRANTPLSLGDREFAMRFFFIVFTDCLCWTPIIVLRIMALAEVDLRPEFYAYVVVVLLPINSALNPFLYTFTTTKFRAQIRRFLSGRGVCLCVWVPRQDTGSTEGCHRSIHTATSTSTSTPATPTLSHATHASPLIFSPLPPEPPLCDSETTRTSFFRSATLKLTNGRDLLPALNGTAPIHTVDDTTVAEVSRSSLGKDEVVKVETRL